MSGTGLIDDAAAGKIYGVVLSEGKVDQEATERLRKASTGEPA